MSERVPHGGPDDPTLGPMPDCVQVSVVYGSGSLNFFLPVDEIDKTIADWNRFVAQEQMDREDIREAVYQGIKENQHQHTRGAQVIAECAVWLAFTSEAAPMLREAMTAMPTGLRVLYEITLRNGLLNFRLIAGPQVEVTEGGHRIKH